MSNDHTLSFIAFKELKSGWLETLNLVRSSSAINRKLKRAILIIAWGSLSEGLEQDLLKSLDSSTTISFFSTRSLLSQENLSDRTSISAFRLAGPARIDAEICGGILGNYSKYLKSLNPDVVVEALPSLQGSFVLNFLVEVPSDEDLFSFDWINLDFSGDPQDEIMKIQENSRSRLWELFKFLEKSSTDIQYCQYYPSVSNNDFRTQTITSSELKRWQNHIKETGIESTPVDQEIFGQLIFANMSSGRGRVKTDVGTINFRAVSANLLEGLKIGGFYTLTLSVQEKQYPPDFTTKTEYFLHEAPGDFERFIEISEGLKFRWSSILTPTEAQQVSNVKFLKLNKGEVTELKAGYYKSWFVDEFFENEKWKPVGKNEKFNTFVDIKYFCGGEELGVASTEISYRGAREKGGNATTYLHWPDEILAWFKDNNASDFWAVFDRISIDNVDEYELTITDIEPDFKYYES